MNEKDNAEPKKENKKRSLLDVLYKFLGIGNKIVDEIKETRKENKKFRVVILISAVLGLVIYAVNSIDTIAQSPTISNFFSTNNSVVFENDDYIHILFMPFKEYGEKTSGLRNDQALVDSMNRIISDENLPIEIVFDENKTDITTKESAINYGKEKKADIVFYGVIDGNKKESSTEYVILKERTYVTEMMPEIRFFGKSKSEKFEMSKFQSGEMSLDEMTLLYHMLFSHYLNTDDYYNAKNTLAKFQKYITSFNNPYTTVSRQQFSAYITSLGIIGYENFIDFNELIEIFEISHYLDNDNYEAQLALAFLYFSKQDFRTSEMYLINLSSVEHELQSSVMLSIGFISGLKGDLVKMINYFDSSITKSRELGEPPLAGVIKSLVINDFEEFSKYVKEFKVYFSDEPEFKITEISKIVESLYKGDISGLTQLYDMLLNLSNDDFEESRIIMKHLFSNFSDTDGTSLANIVSKNNLNLNKGYTSKKDAYQDILLTVALSESKSDIRAAKKRLKKYLKNNPNDNLLGFNEMPKTVNDSLKEMLSNVKKLDFVSLSNLNYSLGFTIPSKYYIQKALREDVLNTFELDYFNNLEIHTESFRVWYDYAKKSYTEEDLMTTYESLGWAFYNSGMYSELDLIIELLRGDDNKKRQRLKLQGSKFYMLGDYEISLDYYLSSLEVDPNKYHTLWGISECLFKLGRYDEAFIKLNESIQKLEETNDYSDSIKKDKMEELIIYKRNKEQEFKIDF